MDDAPVTLKVAEAQEAKRILLSLLLGAGMDIKTTTINRLLETSGRKRLAADGDRRE